ncbi:hypothetical protein GOP47_0030591 [Adiantum capillus-veneris]|nr:hypothetical protein GOP47_0030591 [Adiantum capillus-veneris]
MNNLAGEREAENTPSLAGEEEQDKKSCIAVKSLARPVLCPAGWKRWACELSRQAASQKVYATSTCEPIGRSALHLVLITRDP